MPEELSRKKTFNESLYSLAQEISPSFTLQFLLTGVGALEKNALEQAIVVLSKQLPQLRIQSSGSGWNFDGPLPSVVFHRDAPPEWNDTLFKSSIPNALLEFHLFETGALLFRIHHSVTDARGAQLILAALFAILRNESPEIYTGFDRDDTAVKSLNHRPKSILRPYRFSWPGFALSPGSHTDYQTCVIRLPFKLEGALAKISLWYSQQLKAHCRVLIPVDIRRHDDISAAVSNMTLPVYIDVETEARWQDVQSRLLHALQANQELAKNQLDTMAAMAPHSLLRKILSGAVKKATKTKRYPISGIISDNGTIDPADFSTDRFLATELVSLPVFVPLAPMCVNVILQPDRSLIAFTIPAHLDGHEMQADLSGFLSSGTEPTNPVDNTAAVDEQAIAALADRWSEILACPIDTVKPEARFHQLGGDSLKFLTMLSELATDYSLQPHSAFISQALDTGGDINIRELLTLMERYYPVENSA